MQGYQVDTLENHLDTADIFITTTGNKDIIMAADLARMKNKAIVGNIGHFDNEIDMAGLAAIDGIEKIEVKPQVHEWKFTERQEHPRPLRGSSAQPRQRHRPPVIRDEQLVHEPDDRPDRALHQERRVREAGLRPAQAPRREGRPPAPRAVNVNLTELRPDQAAYIGVPVEGPYKPEHYRY